MKWFWDNYTSNQTNRKEPTVSPLQAMITRKLSLVRLLVESLRQDYSKVEYL